MPANPEIIPAGGNMSSPRLVVPKYSPVTNKSNQLWSLVCVCVCFVSKYLWLAVDYCEVPFSIYR